MLIAFPDERILCAKHRSNFGIHVWILDHTIESRAVPVEIKALVENDIIVCLILGEEGLCQRPGGRRSHALGSSEDLSRLRVYERFPLCCESGYPLLVDRLSDIDELWERKSCFDVFITGLGVKLLHQGRVFLDEHSLLLLVDEGLFAEVLWILHREVVLVTVLVWRQHSEEIEFLRFDFLRRLSDRETLTGIGFPWVKIGDLDLLVA